MIYLPNPDICEIQTVLSSHSEIVSAKIFRSRAKGTHKRGSDIDIALELQPYSYDTLLDIFQELDQETLLPYFFDIVEVNHIENVKLKEHINRGGQFIYQK